VRDQARKVRKVRDDDIRLETERPFERALHVVLEIDHVEAVSPELDGGTPGGRETHLVAAGDEAADRAPGAERASEPVARDAVKDAHAIR
jgi:hypothetical protein